MGEAVAEEVREWAGFDAELGVSGLEGPAENGGVDFGRWREGVGRQGEELFDGAVELDGEGEQSVVAGAGRGGDAVGDFTLDHEDGAFDGLLMRDEMEQDL